MADMQNDAATDISGAYMNKRKQGALSSAGQSLIDRVKAQPPGGENAPPTPVDQQLREWQQQQGPGVSVMFPNADVAPDGQSNTVRAISENVSEIPRQAVGGISDAVHNSFMALDGVATWLNDNVADLRVPVPDTGIDQLDLLIQEPLKALAGRGSLSPGEVLGKTAEGRPIIFNDEGGVSTEQTTTVEHPDIPGKWINIPTLYGGKKVSDEAALKIIQENGFVDPDTGKKITAYASTDKAVAAAEKRSKQLAEDEAVKKAFARAKAGPEVSAPRTPTGAVVRDLSRFFTGFVPAMRAAKSAGMGNVSGGMAAGAASDFLTADPNQARLADLWKSMKLPENVLTEYLAFDPEDSEAEGRFKNALEGAVGGTIAEGVFAGARAVRSMVQARAAKQGIDPAALASARMQYGEVADDAFSFFGNPKDPAVKISKAMKDTADIEPSALTKVGEADGNDIFVNFARIDTAEDVHAMIGKTTKAMASEIDEGRRGVQSNEETALLADELGMTPETLLKRRKGQPLNAEEALAARRLWAASAEKLTEAAKKAADPNAGDIDQFNFRRMMAIHHAIQSEVIGARTETARALQSWSIPAGGSIEKARLIQQTMESFGGANVSKEMAKRLALLAEQGVSQAALNAAVRKGWGATTMDAVKESFVLGLLWSPSTHIVNTMSNAAVAAQQVIERGLASNISRAAGRAAGEGVEAGEATMMAYGLISGLKDAFRLAGRSIATGETGASLGKIDLPRYPAISSQAIERELGRELTGVTETGIGKAVDMIGFASRIPGRALGAEDEFFKTIGYRMELHAQALRTAIGEGLKGEAMGRRMAEILHNPPENVRLAAADAALYNTFTNQPGKIGQVLMKARNDIPGAFIMLPFVRTPANILRYTFERSPVAPLVGQWRADIAAGGARADLALARMATGSAVMAVASDYAFSGQVSGAGPLSSKEKGVREAMQRNGWQANSIRIGDTWYSYQRTDPFGMLMGFSASMAELVQRKDLAPEDYDDLREIAAAATMAVSRTVVDKTYFEGVSRMLEAIRDPERYGESYIRDTLASFVPATSALGTATRAMDPVLRETSDTFDAIQSRMLSLAERLPPRRDLWGEEMRPDEVHGRAYDVLVPSYARRIDPNPIDSEIERLRLNVTRIDRSGSFEGVPMNLRDWPKVYDAYVRLAGNDMEHPVWGMGAKDYLTALVDGDHALSPVYEMQTDVMKGEMIRDTIRQFREFARREILDMPEFADFRDAWEAKRNAAAAARFNLQ